MECICLTLCKKICQYLANLTPQAERKKTKKRWFWCRTCSVIEKLCNIILSHSQNTTYIHLSTYSQVYTQIYTIIFYKFHKCILRKEIAFEVSVTYREATQAHTLTHSHNRNSFFTYKHKHSPIHIHTFTYTGLIHDTLGLKCCIVMLLQCVGG